ncbi:calcium-binding protein [Octadecabacter sp. 1_MG-2023]|uniref:calcium-binding protein n=1 Tax=unclassified Octadecabacter TaxID=196158 RepID=UPI001C092619|nr:MULTISPECIES: calcium-binding protein [unclassified Octadecabacter]MBU2993659.1 hypothetical protein [Octadecabacter sp. B2R22]MDO6735497.1 calcium-binding protein [Octadecabacter sp. 1_MG-2023]
MTPFDDYIAERTSLGKMAQTAVVTAPSGEQVLFFVDPTGYVGNTNGVDYLYRAIIFDGDVRIVGAGPGVADGSLLNAVLTPQGPAVEYEFYRGGIFQVTVLSPSGGIYPSFNSTEVADYSEVNPDAGLAIFGDGGRDNLVGTDLDDVMRGNGSKDTIDGGAGDDLIYGGNGTDSLKGGDGDDRVFGNNGADSIEGGDGDDYIHGGNNNDIIFGGSGHDQILGGNANDRIWGGSGDDELRGGQGWDYLSGGEGSDVIRGNAGRDTLTGLSGDDILQGGDGNDRLLGGLGNDILSGGAGHDTLEGHQGDNVLYGGDGNDVLYTAGGDDVVIGGSGVDEFYFSGGTDVLKDFEADLETMHLAVYGAASYAPSFSQVGSDVVISYGNTSHGASELTLQNVLLSDLTDENILF